jgi:hypothetical protein
VDSRTIELQNIEDWAVRNNLQLNRKKSQEIVFFKPYTRKANIPVIPEIPGVPRVNRIKLLGVVLADNFSMEDHIASVLSSSASALYALKILRAHGMDRDCIQKVFQATVIARLMYASPAWWGFTTETQRERLESFLRRSVKAGFCSNESPDFASLCEAADACFLRKVESNPDHLLRSLLPPPIVDKCYNMRARKHKYSLPLKVNNLFEKNFFIRMFYKD